MKVAIITTFVLIASLWRVNAQNMIGSSEAHILSFMKGVATNKKLVEHKSKPDGTSGIAYAHLEEEGVYTVYNLKDKICIDYFVLYPKKYLSTIVKAYSDNYIRQSDNEWVNKELTLKMKLHIDDGDLMAMRFESLK